MIRVTVGMLLIVIGWFGYEVISSFFNPVRYTTTSYYELLLQEWLAVAMLIFCSFVPTLFLALKIVFPWVSWKKLAAVTLIVGGILAIRPYLHNLKLWQPLIQTLYKLPITEVEYERHTGAFPDVPDKMIIFFVIPDKYFQETERTIKMRLAAHNGASLQDITENYIMKGINPPDTPYEYWYSVDRQTADKVEARLYRTKF